MVYVCWQHSEWPYYNSIPFLTRSSRLQAIPTITHVFLILWAQRIRLSSSLERNRPFMHRSSFVYYQHHTCVYPYISSP